MSAGHLDGTHDRRAAAETRRAIRRLGSRVDRLRRPRLASRHEDVHPEIPTRLGPRAVEDARTRRRTWRSRRRGSMRRTTSASWPAAAIRSAATDAARDAFTVATVAQRFLDDYVTPRKKPSTVRLYRLAIDAHITPRLGAVPIADVSHEDAVKLHDRLRATPILANRVLAVLSKLLAWSMTKAKYRPAGANPCHGIEKVRRAAPQALSRRAPSMHASDGRCARRPSRRRRARRSSCCCSPAVGRRRSRRCNGRTSICAARRCTCPIARPARRRSTCRRRP